MESAVSLQEIIGVDKSNPHFTVCKNSQQPGKLQVFFGAALLETIEDDREHPNFKLLLARLYNAGVKPASITSAFAVPYTTLRRWAEALQSGEADRLIRVLAGRQHPRKLTPEILSFAEKRFHSIYADNRATYSKEVREEITDVFGLTISAESLRPYFCQWKSKGLVTTSENDGPCLENKRNDAVRETSSHPSPVDFEADEQEQNDHPVGQLVALELPVQEVDESIRKHAVENDHIQAVGITAQPQQDFRFCHHAGILLFSAYLNRFEAVLGGGADLIKQWIVTVLLGAVNIEQSKLLNGHDLQRLLGQVTVNLNQQRQALGELALADCLMQVLRINGECVGIDQCHDFYYDPHSKHYTGMHKTLKGWCSRLRFAEKILHMDFIHTSLGFPVYIHHDDNFYDLRERFIKVINAFRQQFGFEQQRSLTFVVDRGVYGMDFFESIIKDESQTYFVTWEKGYQGDIEEPIDWAGCIHLYKERNSSKKLLQYTFSYNDQLWSRQKNMRRLIVRATNPKGNTIQVSILTNDLHRSAKDLIELMFTRWIQENDFKYLDTHFGINEITSYGVIAYKDLEKVENDRQVKTGQYKALEKERTCIKGKLKTRLLRAHCAKKENPKREQEIDELTQQLDAVETELSQTDKEVSRLSSLIDSDFNKLDTIKKSLMDGIKITARNFFYLLLQPFKQAYDNYRDDHVFFRHLTRSSGLIRYQGNVVEVLLIPEADYPPKVAKIIDDMLAQLNANQMAVPDSSGGVLHFRLARSESMRLIIRPTTREIDLT